MTTLETLTKRLIRNHTRLVNQTLATSIDLTEVPDGHIVDYINGKFRKDKPEEYVRQNIERRLVHEHEYPPEDIGVEVRIKMGSKKPAADLVIYEEGSAKSQENIQIIIECKRESIEATDKKEGVGQLQSYMAACINAEWGMWTNGKTKFAFQKTRKNDGTWKFVELNDIPSKGQPLSELDRPARDSLKNATGDNLLYSFKTCHNHIYVNDGMQKQQAFFELLKVIFCKILDERNLTKKLDFYAGSSEKLTTDGQLTTKNRINTIFEKVKKRYTGIFSSSDEIKLTPVSLAHIVSELQKYSLLKTNIDVKGKAYEEIVGSNLRGDRGEFFTPKNIVRMAIQMLNIPLEAKILDPACGTGGFLVTGMNNVIDELRDDREKELGKPRNEWSTEDEVGLMDKIREIASGNFFGSDINPDLVKASKMNMVMNNDGEGNIFKNNSLTPPHTWPDDTKKLLCSALGLDKDSIRRSGDLALFDFVVTNPPFGAKLPIKDLTVLEQYDLAHVWKKGKDDGKIIMTDRLMKSRPPEVLFIERCYHFLKEGGVMAIVLPDAILGAPGIEYASIREWMIQKMKIIASIDLHQDAFQPSAGTQTSVVFAQKKTTEERQKELEKDVVLNYNIFFAIAEKIGHDKRGNPIFRRDDEGNELFVDVEEEGHLLKHRIEDDQTMQIADVFLKWRKEHGFY